MRKIDFLVLMIAVAGAFLWMIVSAKDGFKANNATIVARSISIASTIDGQIENDPPKVGERVAPGDLLVRIQNGRFDRSRLAELESQIGFLDAEIANIDVQQTELKQQLAHFRTRAKSYSAWMLKEVELKSAEDAAALEIARKRYALTNGVVERANRLYEKKLASKADLQTAKTEAEVAKSQVQLNKAQLKRSQLLLEALKRDGVFFENGDTSYWAKMVDTLQVRIFDNTSRISTLRMQLVQAKLQASVERLRIHSSASEEHRAPFNGVVNAAFVNRGSRVTSGTSLYQVLDCTNPVIIIPIPDNRISEFSVGLRVTVYPTDTEQELPGKISYVTSGALIGADTSIQIQQDLILNGNRAIVSLDDKETITGVDQSCETERKAIVVIHTKSWFDTASAWTSRNMPRLASWISSGQAIGAETENATLPGKS